MDSNEKKTQTPKDKSRIENPTGKTAGLSDDELEQVTGGRHEIAFRIADLKAEDVGVVMGDIETLLTNSGEGLSEKIGIMAGGEAGSYIAERKFVK